MFFFGLFKEKKSKYDTLEELVGSSNINRLIVLLLLDVGLSLRVPPQGSSTTGESVLRSGGKAQSRRS